MEDIKIWTLDGSKATPLDAVSEVESEWDLEGTLVNNPGLLMDGLALVGRQTSTEGGRLDLLGVDEYGRLCVFELKRGTVARDAVAQIIDYASDLDMMGWADLCRHISENSGSDGIEEIEDFEAWYNENYDDPESLKPPRLFLVGLGVDDRTERMANFLAGSGVDISLLTFHGFAHAGKTLLAKQVEVEGGSIEFERQRTSRYASRSEKQAMLDQRIEKCGARALFDAVTAMFREEWGERATYTPNRNSLRISLPTNETTRGRGAYARVNPGEKVRIVFYPRAFALATDDFRRATEVVDNYDTWPRNLDPLEETNIEIQFPLTAAEWERRKGILTALTQAVYVAWKNAE